MGDLAAYTLHMLDAYQLFRDFIGVKKIILPKDMLRLWNDAATYDVQTENRGVNGSIRHWDVLKAYANSDLGKSLHICEEMKAACPSLTYADIIQIGGVVAVEVAAKPCVDFDPGSRKDSLASPKQADLPDSSPGLQHRLSIFCRMGLSDDKEDIGASIGKIKLVRAFPESPGFEDACYVEPAESGNSYFVDILRREALSYLVAPADRALLQGPNFRQYIKLYAKNVDAFFADYAVAHKKFPDLGFKRSSADHKVEDPNNTALTKSMGVIAIAAVVVVFCSLLLL